MVHHLHPKTGEPLGQARYAKGRGPHVYASTVTAEVERDANDVDSLHVLGRNVPYALPVDVGFKYQIS